MQITHAMLALVALSPLSAATTWIVDVNNGPGTNFTQISTAIANVSAGDTLIVRAGLYDPFVVDKQLSIIGLTSGEAQFTSAIVQNLPAGSTSVMANLYQLGAGPVGVAILNSAGALMLDQISCTSFVQVSFSNDVRFRRLDAPQGMGCTNARVEIADSTIVGMDGQSCFCTCGTSADPGSPGLIVSGGEVHVARTRVTGGRGGNAGCSPVEVCDANGGDGGPGIELVSGARLLLCGTPQEAVTGGQGGTSICKFALPGAPGPALSLSMGCEARTSGELLSGWILNQGGTITHPSLDDPSFVGGTPTAGSTFTMSVHGPVGATADVILGRRPIIVSTPELDEEQLTPVNRVFHLGVIPASGTVSLSFPVGATWPQGFSVVFQGRLDVSGSTVYTNSLPAIVQ